MSAQNVSDLPPEERYSLDRLEALVNASKVPYPHVVKDLLAGLRYHANKEPTILEAAPQWKWKENSDRTQRIYNVLYNLVFWDATDADSLSQLHGALRFKGGVLENPNEWVDLLVKLDISGPFPFIPRKGEDLLVKNRCYEVKSVGYDLTEENLIYIAVVEKEMTD